MIKRNNSLHLLHFVSDLHMDHSSGPTMPFDVRLLAAGTYRPGSGCCTSCMRSRRPLCVRTPLRPRPPWRDELSSGPRTRRTAPAAERSGDKHTNAGWVTPSSQPTDGGGPVGLERCTYDDVLFGHSGMQVVHSYFRPLQRTDNRLERYIGLFLITPDTDTSFTPVVLKRRPWSISAICGALAQ